MSSKALCALVRAAAAAVAACGLAGCIYLPKLGQSILAAYPEYAYCYYPWLIFLWLAALPCFAVLMLVWQTSVAIKHEQVFTFRTARLVKAGALLLLADAAFVFAGNAALLLLNMNHPGIFLAFLFADIFAVSLAVMAAVLSRYLTKAAALQEEADGTI